MTGVVIYTDGACRGNPGPGDWGVLLRAGQREKVLYGAEAETTNNRMELTAAIKALEALKRRCQVSLHTDSTYVRNGITEWLVQNAATVCAISCKQLIGPSKREPSEGFTNTPAKSAKSAQSNTTSTDLILMKTRCLSS